ncbi:hypothetical protein VA596_41475 [Amycolatopsis sp., V23-08]|uniref:Uncharacterized protein n=1 Tax=Amycolatopsis heterodermiae TaxID=3110235 RepID=A0ABU5RIE7_9PSEU|nr:hypothetical protein [Amycolatopsis sp., V23-08]MEA5366057.1 hypothetical protein [Amycolatopsis sp., V23-08]
MTNEQSTQDTTSTEGEAPDFAATLLAIGSGRTHRDLSEQLREVIKACNATFKAGKVQLTLNFKPQKGTGAMFVTADVKVAKPKFDADPSIFYASEDGALHRNNPNQQSLY